MFVHKLILIVGDIQFNGIGSAATGEILLREEGERICFQYIKLTVISRDISKLIRKFRFDCQYIFRKY